MTLCEDGFVAAVKMVIQSIYRFLIFLPEYLMVIITLIATIAVVRTQCDAVNTLFNFLGVLVIGELDDICKSVIFFKIKRLKMTTTDESMAAYRISVAGAMLVITFIYTFVDYF